MIGTTIPETPRPEWPTVPPVTLPETGSDLVVVAVVGFALVVLALAAFLVRNRIRP